MVYWDGSGIWILMRRLGGGRFCRPHALSDHGPAIAIKPEALVMLLSGVDLISF
jgi:transposase